MKFRSIPVVFFLNLFVTIAVAQAPDRQTVSQSIEWFSLTTNIKVTPATTLIAEGQFRFAHTLDPMQFQLRTGVDFKLSKHFSVVPFGYVYTLNEQYGKQPATFINNEHRFWEQIAFKHTVGKLKIDHRLRYEQRFIQVHTKTAEGTITNEGFHNQQTRLRYRLMGKLPLAKENESMFLSFYDEVFFSSGKKVTYHEPDQNRAFLGMGFPMNKSFTLQGGFLYQMLVKENGLKQENNLGIQVMATYNIDLIHQ
jgi:hypothetical protein